jgi:predicted RNA-binding protein with PUA-like domain
MPRCWLAKSEPDSYSIDDLARDGRTWWDGIRNHQVRNMLRDEVQVGDLVLFYHSNAEPPGVVGVARVLSPARPDEAAFDPTHKYYDPKSKPEAPTWLCVELGFAEKLPRVVSLAELKADPALDGVAVTRKGQRLSFMPVSDAHFAHIVALGRGPAA